MQDPEPGADLDNLDADIQAQVNAADQGASPTDEGGEGGDTKAAAAGDKDIAAKVEKLQESYDNVRSYADKTSGENSALKSDLAKLQGQIELLTSQSQRGVDPAVAAAEQKEFDKNWAEKIDQNPAAAIDFVRGTMGDLKNQVLTEAEANILAKVEERFGKLPSAVSDLDPDYRQNKDVVDKIMEGHKVDRSTAVAIAKEFNLTKQVEQPGRPPAPGTTGTGRSPETGGAPKQKFVPNAQQEEVWRLSGLSDKDIKELQDELAQEAG